MKVRKSTALTVAVALVGLGSLIVGAACEDGNGALNGGCCCCGCCFFAVVRFFVDDGMVAGNVAVKNSCRRVAESENTRDNTQIRGGLEVTGTQELGDSEVDANRR